MTPVSKIDISENTLRNRGRVLDILLLDRASRGNIIWATDSYKVHGKEYMPKKQIKRELVTGLNGKIIQPRAAKSREEQAARTKDKAEVFTPLKIVREMNMSIDWESKNYPTTKDNWIDYIKELRLEVSCGEAPFIAGRYNPTANTGVTIKTVNRVGFLDRKLQAVGEFTKTKKEWLKYAEVALKASYGFEWQGDNLLIARENILLTIDDFYKDFCANKLKQKTKQSLSDAQLEYFAEIICWNIWQMDGLKYVKPMSCTQSAQKSDEVPKDQLILLQVEKTQKTRVECEGCRTNDPLKHTGRYSRIMDWEIGKSVQFVDLLSQGDNNYPLISTARTPAPSIP